MTSSLRSVLFGSALAARKRLPRQNRTPRLETLEDRCVLTASFQFSASVYSVANTQQAILITVTKTDTTTPRISASVDYSATPSQVAQPSATPGVDFVPTSGTLNFSTETTSQSFTVAILPGDQNGPFINPVFYVDLNLRNPTNGAELGTPSQALLRITTTKPSQLTLTPFNQQAAQNVLLNAQLAQVQDAVANLQSSSYKAIVSWGDNTPLVTLPLQPQGTVFTVNGSHVYATEGTFTFSVTVIPANGPSATTTGTVVVGGFVTGLYNDLFGRAPDQAGLQFWDTLIATGTSRQQVAFLFWNTPEHQAVTVQQFYQAFLGRPADTAGLVFWTNKLVSGTSEVQVATAFSLTPEFLLAHPTNNLFAAGVYLAVEGSLPSLTNVFFVQILNAFNLGLIGRPDVTPAVLGLPETYTNAVDQLYQTFLRRSPDAAGRLFFTGEMLSGNFSPAFIGSQILATPEYLALQDAIAIGAISE